MNHDTMYLLGCTLKVRRDHLLGGQFLYEKEFYASWLGGAPRPARDIPHDTIVLVLAFIPHDIVRNRDSALHVLVDGQMGWLYSSPSEFSTRFTLVARPSSMG